MSHSPTASNRDDENRASDDEMRVIRLNVTNPAGTTFRAFLVDGGFSKAGVVEFFVAPGDAPPGEAEGKRCEAYRQIVGHPEGRFYTVKRASL